MIVERVNRFYNKGLRIFTNERNLVAVSREGILLLTYAWNASPVPMTDISRSMTVCGRDFASGQQGGRKRWHVQGPPLVAVVDTLFLIG